MNVMTYEHAHEKNDSVIMYMKAYDQCIWKCMNMSMKVCAYEHISTMCKRWSNVKCVELEMQAIQRKVKCAKGDMLQVLKVWTIAYMSALHIMWHICVNLVVCGHKINNK